jgi:hypothetical protein
MTKTFEDSIASFPRSLEPEFVMTSFDEPIYLSRGRMDLLREDRLIGHLEGELALEWLPKLQIVCRGETDTAYADFLDGHSLTLYAPQLELTTDAFVTNMYTGKRYELRALLMSADNQRLQSTEQFRFYLVNFPPFLGEPIRTGSGSSAALSRGRLRMTAGSLRCTIDRIGRADNLIDYDKKPGYLITHVAEVQRPGQLIAVSELKGILEALYWLFTFMRGARTGPILPSVDSPFAKHWISVAPWTVDEPRRVYSWLPERSPINADSLFRFFLDKWVEPAWNEALRTTIAWYVAANSPSTSNEARIPLCQIALEVLASLRGIEGGAAHNRLRQLLVSLHIPTQVPPRLQALHSYAARLNVDAPKCLTQIRNKLEHPTAKNRQHVVTVDGTTRMQAAQYGMELFELCLLALMDYQGKYTRRAFQGWKGDDEIPVPWV